MKTLLLNMVIVFVVFATTGMALAGPHGNSGASHPQNSYRAATPVLPKPVSSAATYNGGSYHRAPVNRYRVNYFGADYYYAPSDGEDTMDSTSGYNDPASLAQMNGLQAQQLALENQRLRAENQEKVRKMRVELREAENQKRMALARERNAARPPAAKPASLVSPRSGIVAWPTFLQKENYSDYRAKVDKVLQQKARTGQVSGADRQQIAEMTDQILEELKADVQNMRPQDYVAVKGFARQLLAELKSQSVRSDPANTGGMVADAKPAGN